MTTDFVAVPEAMSKEEALKLVEEKADPESVYYVYVVDVEGVMKGVLNVHHLLAAAPGTSIREITTHGIVFVFPEFDQERVAEIFARYDLFALPVVDQQYHLLGIITSDDVIDVIHAEHTEDVMRLSGSDAAELEKRKPVQIAMMRLPWLLATMFIELGAGVVIHWFDATLSKIILLASFMPIISAISGNTGLQSATIVVRGLATGHIQPSDWWRPILRQFQTTLILGTACGTMLGLIGALWYGRWVFGVLVGASMFTSINIAGIVGTMIPMLSKRLGFDPAITAGPFETAFQDVVGISIFLGMATLLLHWLK
jgi:magnesium transporter